MQVSKRVKTLLTALSFTLSLTTMSVQAAETESINTQRHDIKTRQHAFSQIDKQQKLIYKGLEKSSSDWAQLAVLSTELTANSGELQHLFIQGSQVDSKAKDAVWDDNIKFKTALAKMDNHFIDMATAIQEQDKHSAKAALKQANNTCRSCHRQYRSRW